uniref:C3H1-type domain-containing protein n=1 Tax=Kalanchoe fedtschenkoi TaxID=63787 RepID=A0A7N0V8B5_KALFE
MMIGEPPRSHPTIQIPPNWDPYEDPTADINSPLQVNGGPFGSPDFTNPFSLPDSFGSLQRYLPSNEPDMFDDEFADLPLDAFSCDNFRMYDFKVRRCARGRSHDWTECPFAHPGEKARRRDPRKYSYSGTACPEFRKGSCRRGDACEFAHGVFECWLHPDRYRTQACKDGLYCRRRICFFAHSQDQLRVINTPSPRKSLISSNSADSYDGSPLRRSFDSFNANTASFCSTSPPTSPPSSPPLSTLLCSSYGSVNELVSNMRGLQLAKAAPSPTSTWATIGSPRGSSNLRPGFFSLPTTPTRVPARSGRAQFEQWDSSEEPVMERVESGRDLRAKIYAKLSKDNSFGPVNDSQLTDPDVAWISDLVQ